MTGPTEKYYISPGSQKLLLEVPVGVSIHHRESHRCARLSRGIADLLNRGLLIASKRGLAASMLLVRSKLQICRCEQRKNHCPRPSILKVRDNPLLIRASAGVTGIARISTTISTYEHQYSSFPVGSRLRGWNPSNMTCPAALRILYLSHSSGGRGTCRW